MDNIRVIVQEVDYDYYRIGLATGDRTVYVFKSDSEAGADLCRDCMEAGLKAAVQYFRFNVPWRLTQLVG